MQTVFMSHPDTPDHAPAVTSREAFDALWAAKGWELVESDGSPITSPADLKGQALDQALQDAGLPVTGTAADKRAALAAHLGQEV